MSVRSVYLATVTWCASIQSSTLRIASSGPHYFACTRAQTIVIVIMEEHVSLRATREFAHCTYSVSVGEVHFYAAHDVSIRKRETRRVCAGWSVQCASDVVGSLEVAEFRVACTTLHYWKDSGDVEIFVRVEDCRIVS